jgi:ribonuclease HII
MLQFEEKARASGHARIAGVDEAGRGPLAGPIVAAAVILSQPVPGLNDSKQLTAAKRDHYFELLHEQGHDIGVSIIDADVIDEKGLQWSNYSAMTDALAALPDPVDYALVDGFSLPGCTVPHLRLIKGDSRSMSIAAASVIAKVTRDRIMVALDLEYPGYGFARHKGYGTRHHMDQLKALGPCPIHRRSFAPIAAHTETLPLLDPKIKEVLS